MRVAIDPEPCEKPDAERRRLAEVMPAAEADGEDTGHVYSCEKPRAAMIPVPSPLVGEGMQNSRLRLDHGWEFQLSPNTRLKIVSTCLKW
jgi:hypothetical protein